MKCLLPSGAERTAINKAFDSFIGELQTKETDKGIALFSLTGSSVALPVDERISEAAAADEVEQRIGDFAHQPPVLIRDSATGAIPAASDGHGVAGAVHKGAIYLFRDQLGSRQDVQRTLFHELLHYGLRRFLTREQYEAQMLRLYRRDAYIRSEADRWVLTDDGARAQAFGGRDYALARGVDEALATLAEPNAGAYLNTSAGARLLRTLAKWAADLAELLGFKPLAAEIRGWKNQEARAFIESVFKRLADDAPATSSDWAFTSDPAFQTARRNSPPFYSALTRAIEGVAMKQGTAGAWGQFLKGMVASGKVKADELEWSGLSEWLNLQPGKITKEQIADYLAAGARQGSCRLSHAAFC